MTSGCLCSPSPRSRAAALVEAGAADLPLHLGPPFAALFSTYVNLVSRQQASLKKPGSFGPSQPVGSCSPAPTLTIGNTTFSPPTAFLLATSYRCSVTANLPRF